MQPPDSFDYRQAASLTQLLLNRARLTPEKTAFGILEFGGAGSAEGECRRCTYAELDARARRVAVLLRGMAPVGARALLLYPPGLDFLGAFFGCLYAGIVAVPTYPPRRNRPDTRLQGITLDSGARVALSLVGIMAESEVRFRQTPQLAALTWLASDAPEQTTPPVDREPEPASPQTTAFLQYTSGSTGTPKGVIVTHGNLLSTLEDLDRGFEHDAGSVMVSWLPTFHDLGLIYGALLPVYAGFPAYLMAPAAFLQRPARWLEAISRLGGTHTAAPNFAFDLCVSGLAPEQAARLDLRSLRCALNAAETVRPETVRRFTEAFAPAGLRPGVVRPGYGLAEATLKVSTHPLRRPLRELRVSAAALARHRVEPLAAEAAEPAVILASCGVSHAGMRIEIVDPERAVRVAAGTVGEVWVAGVSVAQGYLGRPEESEQTFRARLLDGSSPDRFLRTGDLGFLHEGELFLCGRCKEVIIVRGLNHYPQDIEATAQRAHPALRANAGAAFAVEVDGEERLVVVQEVERTQLRQLDVEAVAGAVRGAVAQEHEVPLHALVLVKPGAVAKTSSGKIQRRAMRTAFASGGIADPVAIWRAPQPVGGGGKPPGKRERTVREVEDWLLDFCVRRCGGERAKLGLTDPFTRHGLDSVLAVDLARELEQWLDRPVPDGVVYDSPSIAALAARFGENPSGRPTFQARSALRGKPSDGIAVIGMGGRFPGAADLDAYWKMLSSGKDAVTEIPAGRPGAAAFHALAQETGLPQITRGGFLEAVEAFDAAFFDISPREAESLDPQQRLLLEVSWQALEDAGLSTDELAGSATGVFVGLSTNDYARLLPCMPDRYAGTGNALCMAANRLSYFYDWRGPSVVVDTACSSSLVAVHQACASLRAGECDLALAGGVNLILSPHWSVSFARAGMLAPDGRCKTFDAKADGYVRGEGGGLVVLQRLADARRGGRPILAVLRGSAINQDGRSNGLTAPNGQRQHEVIARALVAANVAPAEVSYIETHGTGTPLGDPIEVAALREALGAGRDADQPLWLGSVKTNIGHLEAAAGIAGLIKVVLALKHRRLPAHLNFSRWNPKVPDGAGRPLISETFLPWETGEGHERIAGVSSFGFGGTNAHVVVEEFVAAPSAPMDPGDGPLLLALSARSADALRESARAYARVLDGVEEGEVRRLIRAAAVLRPQHRERAAAVADTPAALVGAVREAAGLARTPEAEEATLLTGQASQPPRVAFLFTGQGSLYPGMARELYRAEPVFRGALEQCAALLEGELPVSLIPLLLEETSAGAWRQTLCAQPALFSLAWALAALWRSWGVVPDAVLGHSVGEYAAAGVAGVFDLPTGLRIITERARQMQALPAGGAMAAVFGPTREVEAGVQATGGGLGVAVFNGPAETVISGPGDAVRAACLRFQAAGMRVRDLEVSHAFHSELMEPMLRSFADFLGTQTLSAPNIPLVSNVTGGSETSRVATPGYWVDHVRQPVRFADGLAELHRQGCRVFVEIGPKPILTALARRALPKEEVTCVSSLRPDRPDRRQLAEAVAALFTAGARVSWRGFYREGGEPMLKLPTYPFQRRPYWPPPPSPARNGAPAAPPGTPSTVPLPPPVRTTVLTGAALAVLPASERAGQLRRFLEDAVRRILKPPPGLALDPTRGFVDLGMDSIMTVELREQVQRALGCELPVTMAFAYSTLNELTAHLAEVTGCPEEEQNKAEDGGLTDAEIERRIAQKYEQLPS